jgi:hypothetical protein
MLGFLRQPNLRFFGLQGRWASFVSPTFYGSSFAQTTAHFLPSALSSRSIAAFRFSMLVAKESRR